jgi:hypothetical protein
VTLFKVSLSSGIEIASAMTRLGANFLSLAASIGATWLPIELQRDDCNLQREEALAGANGPGPLRSPFRPANRLAFSPSD